MADSDYFVDLVTDLDMGGRIFVENFVRGLAEYRDPKMRIEFYAMGEPIKKKVDEVGMNEAINLWLRDGMGLMFKRKSRPKYEMVVDWRKNKGKDPRPFPWRCIIWMNKAAKQDQVIEFFYHLVSQVNPAFGHITSSSDHRAKHFFEERTERGLEQSYIGLDVGDTLPGIYWVTYFGEWAVKKIGGRDKFSGLASAEDFHQGVLLKSYENYLDVGSEAAIEKEKSIRSKLGAELFFDLLKVRERMS